VVVNVCIDVPHEVPLQKQDVFWSGEKLAPSKVEYRPKKDVFWLVFGRGWSREHSWVGLMWL